MSTVKVIPDNSVAMPDKGADESFGSIREMVEVSTTTASMLSELGLGYDMTPEDEKAAERLFMDLAKRSKTPELPADLASPAVAAKVGALLKAYDQQVVTDAVQLRTLITNKLILLADCGDARYELKALELLGKIQDVGLFSEKSEVTVVHKTTQDLEDAIRERVRRLIHNNTVDVEPLVPVDDLEAELGLVAKEGDADASPDAS